MNPIEDNAILVLKKMVESKREQYDGKLLKNLTELEPHELNDAINHLESIGAIEVIKYFGTTPYTFGVVLILTRGKYLYHELQKKHEEKKIITLPERAFNPVGSPYGFTPIDWEMVSLQKEDKNTIYVVLGMQFKSKVYNTDKLVDNISKLFKKVIETYNKKKLNEHIKLNFEQLSAGYGEHLFNEIARNIIGADIAIFETSDLNPNVMIEMGVALTWGVRVLPIINEGYKRPPSDISGQTWIEYEESGSVMLDMNFEKKLLKMIERSISVKG